MNSAALFLLVAALAAVLGSFVIYAVNRVRRPSPLDFQEQLRAIAPSTGKGTGEQPSGIVPLDPGADEER
ncbi:MAG: hypothetical protein R8F63_19910 [Acidimicrobiales bacterium]|nr:hypothetical protein [Acidimicrobiales bacterium]